jgi:D-inositol-3-phosphate glycosyltransferase
VEAEAAREGSILEFLGSQRDVLALYHRSDAVLMPSLSEGLPMVALEAMACGLPLIASAVGGVPELVVDGDTGILLTSRDPAVWARTLQELAQDREKAQRLGAAGRRRVERDFTERRMLEALNEVYRGALRR